MFAFMNGDPVPPPVPEQSIASSAVVLQLEEVGKKSKDWRLTLHPDHLLLEDLSNTEAYTRSHTIPRNEMMKSTMLLESIRVLAVPKPMSLNFKLTPDQVKILAEWIGKSSLASFYLKRRYAWVLPVAVIWILGSFPSSGDGPDTAIGFDLIGFGLGLALVISWAFAKWRPHPVLFLIDSAWFILLGIRLVMDVINGRSKLWLILAALLIWMVISGLKYFFRFRKIRLMPISA